jgi:hypothetical protein
MTSLLLGDVHLERVEQNVSHSDSLFCSAPLGGIPEGIRDTNVAQRRDHLDHCRVNDFDLRDMDGIEVVGVACAVVAEANSDFLASDPLNDADFDLSFKVRDLDCRSGLQVLVHSALRFLGVGTDYAPVGTVSSPAANLLFGRGAA